VEPFAGLLTLTPNAWEIKPPERARVSTNLYIQLLRKIICLRFAQTCGAKISGRMSGSAAKKIVVNGATAVLLDADKLSAKTSVRNGLGLSLIDDYRMIVLRIPIITYLSNPECNISYSEVLVSTFQSTAFRAAFRREPGDAPARYSPDATVFTLSLRTLYA
jgi:hypothetical protein